MNLKELKANPKNPRKISGKKLELLKKSAEKYGDLSGFVYNIRSKQLVSGHQKQKALQSGKIVIEVRHKEPTLARTVAEGYVQIGDERWKYREVDADATWEAEAMIAANKHGGDWDKDLLRVVIADVPNIDIELAGFEVPELKAMEIEVPEVQVPAYRASPAFSDIGDADDSSDEEKQTDEAYLRENPGEDSSAGSTIAQELNRANAPEIPESAADAFQSIQETTEVVGKRHVIIIDCPSAVVKEALKEKLHAEVTQHGAKFF